ncbi:glycosyl hydrolase [uncultured Draconibacterium sp.]|uniref:glycosyl hydrolase n=1 Tax=uncultured Draconibacterium sp. TaxID=1573823 RepID=UPI0029C74707|nr:glycosyl hydrolase [uncultured Draconibacterium sp.]
MKTNIYLTLFFLSMFFLSCKKTETFESVNPNASKEAKELLAYLYSIRGKKIISGQHNYPHELLRSTDSIQAMTGKLPALWGTDISSMSDKLVEEAIRQHKKGAIITLMYHQVKPFDHDSLGYAGSVKGMVTDEQWEQIITPGSEYYKMLLHKIDQRAEVLKKLRDANIPVLWRPYHEMNGMWFWYGNRPGKKGVQFLWKMMYDRYTNHHKLNNLIWVWNANGPRDRENDEAYAYHLFYPGNEYVDVLAADIYRNDYKQSHHDELVELGEGKLIALGEIGQVPSPEIIEQQPEWAWFMIWARFPWTHNDREDVQKLYNSERVLTLDEIQ